MTCTGVDYINFELLDVFDGPCLTCEKAEDGCVQAEDGFVCNDDFRGFVDNPGTGGYDEHGGCVDTINCQCSVDEFSECEGGFF
ncbi:MAG: hypothetical protein ACOCQG_01670 [Candidatus Nanoarchaeia archaeon]